MAVRVRAGTLGGVSFDVHAYTSGMDTLAGKVAVITGAGSGLGRAMAHRFGSEGMRLVLADIDEPRLRKVGDELHEQGVEVHTQATDVSKQNQVEGLADLAYERCGAVNVLCNNAGVGVVGSAWECSASDWNWAIGVNLWGVVHGLRAFIPRMLEGGEPGHIVNTASIAGVLTPPLSSAYVATKHAVVGLSESLFHDLRLRDAKISASVLCPGFVRTRIAVSSPRPSQHGDPAPVDNPMSEEVGAFYAKSVQDGIEPEKVANAVHDAILEGRFYVFTHPEMKPAVAERVSKLLEGKNPKTRPLAPPT